MSKKSLFLGISFDDSEYLSFNMSEKGDLTIYMKSWEDKPFKVIFKRTIKFSYQLGDLPKDLYERTESPILNEALARKYIEVPTVHQYKLYEIEDIDDFPFIQIVAESVYIQKE